MRELDIDTLPLTTADRDAAAMLARHAPRGSLVIVAGPVAGVVAAALARRWTDPSDVAVLEPETGRWSAAEVRDVISASVTRRPEQRHAVVITAGGTLAAGLYDRLLKVFEEPPAPAWFLLCVPDVAAVPAAIRGRASSIVQARPAGRDERIAAHVAAGVDSADAHRVVDGCHGQVELELAVAADLTLLDPLEQLAGLRAGGPQPLTRAHEAAGLVDVLASAMVEVVGSKTAAQRAAVNLLLARWSSQAAAVLRDPNVDPNLAVAVCDRFLVAVDRAREALERNVAPAAVLASVTAAA